MFPIIVIGSPRSGTSVITRLLQEEFGVMMDEGPIKRNVHNQKGYYEDCQLLHISQGAMSRWKIGLGNERPVDKLWLSDFDNWVKHRKSKYQKWGFKDPSSIGFINWIKEYFKEATYIYTVRSMEQMLASQMKVLSVGKPMARLGIIAYANMIQSNFTMDELHLFDLTKRTPESELIERLGKIVNGC